MRNTQTIATVKIFLFVAVICSFLVAALFFYHTSQRDDKPVLSPDLGIIFPVARDIKSFDLMATTGEKFSQKSFYRHWTLLFFGFTHCASVCPTTLDMLSRAYSKLQDQYPNLQIALVSLDPERDNLQSLATYTHAYDKNFIGVTGKIQDLRKLQGQLGVYSEKNVATGNDYQIQHTSSIMLIDPQGKWAGLFKFGLKPEQFAQAVERSIRVLERRHSASS